MYSFAFYGHEHQLTVDDLFGDGILYYQCPNIGKRTYLVFTIKEGTHEYDYEAVEFKIVLLFLTIYVCPHRTLAQKDTLLYRTLIQDSILIPQKSQATIEEEEWYLHGSSQALS